MPTGQSNWGNSSTEGLYSQVTLDCVKLVIKTNQDSPPSYTVSRHLLMFQLPKVNSGQKIVSGKLQSS